MPDITPGNGPERFIVDEITKIFKKGILTNSMKSDANLFFQQFDEARNHLLQQFQFLDEIN